MPQYSRINPCQICPSVTRIAHYVITMVSKTMACPPVTAVGFVSAYEEYVKMIQYVFDMNDGIEISEESENKITFSDGTTIRYRMCQTDPRT